MQNTQLQENSYAVRNVDAQAIETRTLKDFQIWLYSRVRHTILNDAYGSTSVYALIIERTLHTTSIAQCKTQLRNLKAFYRSQWQYDIENGYSDYEIETAIQIVERCQAYLIELQQDNVQKYASRVIAVTEA